MTSPKISTQTSAKSVALVRCPWTGLSDPLYERYHDEEWGVPHANDRAMFEKLVLEGFQSGLSWITILRKREAFRRAFDGFDPEKVARYGAQDVERLMADAGIVRHGLKKCAARFDAGTLVTPELLSERGLVSGVRRPVKVLARGDVGKALTVRAHKFSGKAAEKIAAAGGSTELIA